MSASGAAVDVRGLSRSFGAVHAVSDVSFTVATGAVFGLLGPDGAGKSTLLRMLATVLHPDAGDASVFGASVTRQPERVTPRIGYMSQQFCMYPDLTVAENLDFFATLRGVGRADRRDRARRLLASMGMAEFTRRQAGRLSGGMKQKLMLASTLMHTPDLLLLDEPTTGVDPVSRREFWTILAQLRDAGTTVLVATPYMDEAERCSHIAFLDDGRITRTGTPAQLKALIPGTVLEVAASDPRAVLARLSDADNILSSHLLGDRVRVLVGWDAAHDAAATHDAAVAHNAAPTHDAAVAVAAVRRELGGSGDGIRIEPIEADMEAAFSYLAEVEDIGPTPARTP